MSVIQRIRDKGAWIVFIIIALALIAFILQDGLYRKGSLFANTTTVGKVDGVSIEKADFERKIEFIQQTNQQAANMPREQLTAGVWNLMVNEVVMNKEYKKLGVQVTGNEISSQLFGANPPQWLVQAFTDPNTGQFNMEQAKQQFNQLKKKKNDPQVNAIYEAYIQPTIDQTLQRKYQSLITGAAYIPKWMVEKMSADNNSIASVSYVFVPYNSVVDSTIRVSDNDIENYVNSHKNLFKQDEETRSVSYVAFDANPSSQDSAAVYKQLEEIKPEFTNTTATNVKTFVASKGSAIPYYDGYVTKSTVQVPNADSILKMADGQVFGPYLDNTNFTLAKMISRRVMPDSVKCRHILIKTENQGQPVLPDSVAKKRIDSIVNAINHGANFDSMVQKFSDDPGSKTTNGEYTFTAMQFGTISKEFAETIFYGKTGDKKTVKVENAAYGGYHYIEVLDQKKFEDAYQIAYISKPISVSAETDVTASNAASQFVAVTRDMKSFEQNAVKQGKPVLPATEIRENDANIGTLGESRTFVRWVYDNKLGTISEPTKINNRYIVAIITNINTEGLQNAATARPMVESIIRNEKKAKVIIDTKMKGNTLESYAQGAGSSVQKADSISFQTPFVPAVGNEPKMVGAAFNKSLQGKASSPIAGTTGVFAIKGESIGAKASMESNPATLKAQLENTLRSMIGYRSMASLRQAAVVKDYRSRFY